jgi:hypothetical protein
MSEPKPLIYRVPDRLVASVELDQAELHLILDRLTHLTHCEDAKALQLARKMRSYLAELAQRRGSLTDGT